MWAKPQTSVWPYSFLNSSNSEPSTSRAMMSWTSNGLRPAGGTTPQISPGAKRGSRGARGLARSAHVQDDALRRLQRGDDAPCDPDRVAVVLRIVIGDAGLPRMHVGAA